MTNSSQKQVKQFEVVLTGGPPWGFTLTGGSEFGSSLFVKKVTVDHQAVGGHLKVGDEILAVNGSVVTSRAKAIQLVRSIEENLRLQICRTQVRGKESNDITYEEMVHNMSDITKRYYSVGNSSPFQQKKCSSATYQMSPNDLRSKHVVHVGVSTTTTVSCPSSKVEHQTSTNVVSTKPTRLFARSNTFQEADNGVNAIEEESVKKVSDARAMFESMALTPTSKSYLPKQVSKTIIDEDSRVVNRRLVKDVDTQPIHVKSRSLPLDMTKKEAEKSKNHKPQRNNRRTDSEIHVRPKSAYSYAEEEKQTCERAPPSRYSQSDMMRPYRAKSTQQDSYNSYHSTDDLRFVHKDDRSNVKPSDPADELRQAASRYHQELLKNYPKFRHSIFGNENVAKFQRKVSSSSSEESFTRGEPSRATIATSNSTRAPRSASASSCSDPQVIEDVLNDDNSIMSCLLREQNQASLMKIDEEGARARSHTGSMSTGSLQHKYAPRQFYLNDGVQVETKSMQTDSGRKIHTNLDSLKDQYDENTCASEQHYTHVETDIDSPEADVIVHSREVSSDSAVYIKDEQQQYFVETLPPPPNELLQDDELVKEKPQRTINRRKKDSSVLNSRNNSSVSTDSITSTATADSGIVVRSDMSPRASPLSGDNYFSNKQFSVSRDDLDDVSTLGPHATSTPEREINGFEDQHNYDSSVHEYFSDNSANADVSTNSPRVNELDGEKCKLIGSMRQKINELCLQEQEITEEIRINEELGRKVLAMVETKATQSEFSKFELFLGELNKIVALLLTLTQRLHRYELMLQELDMSSEEDKEKRDGLVSKIDKLKSQHEEACYLRDVNDKRGDKVATFLEKYCSEEELADFQYYVDMKSQLALMQSEIREKVKLGEERLKALENTGADWGYT